MTPEREKEIREAAESCCDDLNHECCDTLLLFEEIERLRDGGKHQETLNRSLCTSIWKSQLNLTNSARSSRWLQKLSADC